jgi:hypothetical protein
VEDEVEWAEPFDVMGLWERQTGPLTIGWLIEVLSTLDDRELPLEVARYDGSAVVKLMPMHLDVRANEGRASAVVLTVH